MSRRIARVVVCLLAGVLSAVPQAGAIAGGRPDGEAHPNVGALLWRWSDTEYLLRWTGTLLAEDAFPTAGHCVVATEPTWWAVTFDTDLQFTGDATAYGPCDGLRRVSTSPFLGLTKNHLVYVMNGTATGEGGICVLDSGGPQFLGPVEVSLSTGIGGAPCPPNAIGASQRIDLPAVLAFLEPWTS